MNTDDLIFIPERFPAVDPLQFPNITTLAESYDQLRYHAIQLERLAVRVARLNRDAGEIGAGMLAQLVDEARRVLGDKDDAIGEPAAGSPTH